MLKILIYVVSVLVLLYILLINNYRKSIIQYKNKHIKQINAEISKIYKAMVINDNMRKDCTIDDFLKSLKIDYFKICSIFRLKSKKVAFFKALGKHVWVP